MRGETGLQVGLVIGLLILLFAGVIWFGEIAQEQACEDTAEVMGVPWQWSTTTRCMVEVEPGTWIPLDSYKYEK